jgi:hypothetical protein
MKKKWKEKINQEIKKKFKNVTLVFLSTNRLIFFTITPTQIVISKSSSGSRSLFGLVDGGIGLLITGVLLIIFHFFFSKKFCGNFN